MARPGPPPADLSPDTQEARGPIPAPLCSPAGLRARAPPPPASRRGGSGRRPRPGPGAPHEVPSIRPAPNQGPFCLVSPVWTPRGAGRRRCAQPGAGAGECPGRGRAEPAPGEEEEVEAGAPGRAVLEPELRGGGREGGGRSGRPAFGDDAAGRPAGSPAPSGGGSHAAPWSRVPLLGLPCARHSVLGPGRLRGLSADCVWQGAYWRGPKHLPREWSGGRAGVSPPWWAQVEAQGWEAGGYPGWERVPAPRASFSSPFSGLHGRSTPLLWPRGGPAQSLGESCSQVPTHLCFAATHPESLGARG